MRSMNASSALRLELIGPAAVRIGELVLGALRVVNVGTGPQTISARLNLAEGDVRLRVTAPDGSVTTLRGSRQIDAAARTVDLPPGAALESGLGLFHADAGLVLAGPGTYEVVAEFDAVVGQPAVTSAPLRVEVSAADSAGDVELGRLLSQRGVARAFELGEPETDTARKAIEAIASGYAGQAEGRAARLVVAAVDGDRQGLDDAIDAAIDAEGPLEAARTITALVSPAAPNSGMVRDAARARLGRMSSKDAQAAVAVVDTTPQQASKPGRK
jgi:hypothetical protein